MVSFFCFVLFVFSCQDFVLLELEMSFYYFVGKERGYCNETVEAVEIFMGTRNNDLVGRRGRSGGGGYLLLQDLNTRPEVTGSFLFCRMDVLIKFPNVHDTFLLCSHVIPLYTQNCAQALI